MNGTCCSTAGIRGVGSEVNLDKLDEALAYIEAHPDEHDQNSWFARRAGGWCGTTRCLGGTLAWLGGWKPAWEGRDRADMVRGPGGQVRYIRDVAQEILGASDDEAADLFLHADDLDELKDVRDMIAKGVLT